MYGIEEPEISRLHREEVAREVRLDRVSARGSGVIWEFRRNSGRLLKLFQTARNVG